MFQSPEKYDDAIYKNGELTQADVDQDEHGCRGSKKCGDRKRRVGRSAQKAADAAKQALETAKQEFDNLGGAQALQDAESKKTTAQKNVEQAEKIKIKHSRI